MQKDQYPAEVICLKNSHRSIIWGVQGQYKQNLLHPVRTLHEEPAEGKVVDYLHKLQPVQEIPLSLAEMQNL